MLGAFMYISDMIAYSKYARYRPEDSRRENKFECIQRSQDMHTERWPSLARLIEWAFDFVREDKVLPSMRTLQFAGPAMRQNNARGYNCCALPIDDVRAFREIMFLLLGGTGVGYSVQRAHCAKLPVIRKPSGDPIDHIVGDSIEGWGDAVHALITSYFAGNRPIRFCYDEVREKGVRLVTSGGRAPGPKPLREALEQVRLTLDRHTKDGERAAPWVVSDIVCHISDAVRAGGIRRSALIGLFSPDDHDMLSYKVGEYWNENPQRGRANVSAVMHRDNTTWDQFRSSWEIVEQNQTGEHGFYWTNDLDVLVNPCAEASVTKQFCNLTSINATTVQGQHDFNQRCRAAAIIGTLQAAYTEFHYLRPEWQTNTERDALLGVSLTGVASGSLDDLSLPSGAAEVLDTNAEFTDMIGINPAARTTLVKPEGTSSLYLSDNAAVSSGLHDYHDDFYLRRIELQCHDPIYQYLSLYAPEMLEKSVYDKDVAYAVFPMRAPEGASTRTNTTAIELMDRAKKYHTEWVKPGHLEGANTHSVSATITVKPHEWEETGEWMYRNRNHYAGLAVLPYDGGSYPQTPFESITEDEYRRRKAATAWSRLDLTEIIEEDDNTTHTEIVACAGGACSLI